MYLASLRKYSIIDLEGLLLNIPLLVFEYYIISKMLPQNQVYLLIIPILLLVLGASFNKYTGIISLLVLGYLAYTMNILALLYSSLWLTSIAFSNRTKFLDKLLSYMFILLFNAILIPQEEQIYLLISLVPVLLYLSISLERISIKQLSMSIAFISLIIILSKITDSLITLNVFVSVIAVAIYFSYKLVDSTMGV